MRKGIAVNLKDYIKVNKGFFTQFFGNLCFLCADRNDTPETICPACQNDLVFNSNACSACAKPETASELCADCLKYPKMFIDNTEALFRYQYPVNHLVQTMKFRQGTNIANYLGKVMGEIIFMESTTVPDCIIPVPLHSFRLIQRGYNQSIELARPIAKQLGIYLDTHSCQRVLNTIPQTNLPAKKRRKNVRNAFSVTKKINYKHVLIIDDVITTGNTVNEVARVLHKAGVNKIDVLACAKATLS